MNPTPLPSHPTEESTPELVAPDYLAGLVPPGTLQSDEIVLLLIKPSLWFVLLTSARFCVVALLLAMLAVRLLPPDFYVTHQQWAIAATLAILLRLVWAFVVWASQSYLLTERRIITIKGVFHAAEFQCPLRKIQRTVIDEPFVYRLFGIGTIGFATAATNHFDSTWLMVARPRVIHRRIVEQMDRTR
jgi:uncharacterized membrane protein YdbT with pleckstrin-like domain